MVVGFTGLFVLWLEAIQAPLELGYLLVGDGHLVTEVPDFSPLVESAVVKLMESMDDTRVKTRLNLVRKAGPVLELLKGSSWPLFLIDNEMLPDLVQVFHQQRVGRHRVGEFRRLITLGARTNGVYHLFNDCPIELHAVTLPATVLAPVEHAYERAAGARTVSGVVGFPIALVASLSAQRLLRLLMTAGG